MKSAAIESPRLMDADRRFIFIMIFSVILHGVIVYYLNSFDVKKMKPRTIDELPQRIVKLIMNKPKKKEKKKVEVAKKEKKPETPEEKEVEKKKEKAKKVQAAQKNVAKRATKVTKELRTTGMLAILTGKGPTRSRSRSVVDVLHGQSVRSTDLDAALKNMSGVSRAGSAEDMEVKLTTRRSKQSKKVSIKDFVKSFDRKEKTLEKMGNIKVRKPKREGPASSSAMRDDKAISNYVKKNMRSIKAAYNRVLKQNPNLAGKITIRFTILPSGRVSSVSVVESTVDDETLKTRIMRVIKNWRFPSIPDSEGNVTVNFPFIFQPK
jgi:TonB family protein